MGDKDGQIVERGITIEVDYALADQQHAVCFHIVQEIRSHQAERFARVGVEKVGKQVQSVFRDIDDGLAGIPVLGEDVGADCNALIGFFLAYKTVTNGKRKGSGEGQAVFDIVGLCCPRAACGDGQVLG